MKEQILKKLNKLYSENEKDLDGLTFNLNKEQYLINIIPEDDFSGESEKAIIYQEDKLIGIFLLDTSCEFYY